MKYIIPLIASILPMPSATALERAAAPFNKAEYYEREIQIDQIENTSSNLQQQSDNLSDRLQDTENCAKKGSAYNPSTGQCLKYVVNQRTVTHQLINGRTSSARNSRMSADNLRHFKSSNRINISINMTCSYGGGGTWNLNSLDPNKPYNHTVTLCYRNGSFWRKGRAGYVTLQYNPSNGAFSVRPSTYNNTAVINSAFVRFSYGVLGTQSVQ